MKFNPFYKSTDSLTLWVKTEFEEALNGVIAKTFSFQYADDETILISDNRGITAVVVVTHNDELPEKLSRDRLEALCKGGFDLSPLNFYIETNGGKIVYTRDFQLMHTFNIKEGVRQIASTLKRYNLQTVESVMGKYDNPACKKFNCFNISIDLGEITQAEKKRTKWMYEMLAFEFSPYPNKECPWGTYMGPRWINRDGSTYPDLSQITADAVTYWEMRMSATKNPLLISTYAELVWDFKEIATGTKPGGVELDILIDSLVRCAEGDYPEHAIEGLQKLERALNLARQAKKGTLFPRIKQALADYDKRYYKDEHPGVWQYRYDMMMQNISLFSKAEQDDIINQIEGTLQRLAAKKADGKGEERLDPWTVSQTASLLCDYYQKHGDKTKIDATLQIAEDAMRAMGAIRPGMAAAGGYDQMHRIYQHYGKKEKANEMVGEMQREGQNVLKELESHSIEIDYPGDEMKKTEELLTQGSDIEICEKMLLYFLPDRNETEKQVKKQAQASPLSFMIQNNLLDYKGRTKSIIRSIEDDPEGHVVLQYSRTLDIQSSLLRYILQKNIANGVITSDKLYEYLKSSPIVDADRLSIIRRGLDAYFANDYLVTLSLLIPQIEEAIRNIVEKSGGTTLRPQKGGVGFQVRTFDDVLRDPLIDQCFQKEVSFYLRVLFTDQRGWNMRNDICHGLAQSALFNYKLADRVILVLLLLGKVRYE